MNAPFAPSCPRAAALAAVKSLARAGEFFAVVNAAREAIQKWGDPDGRLRYHEVLALARTASTDEACARFAAYGFDTSQDVEIRALGARLIKDAALDARGPARRQGLSAARDAYLAIFRDTGVPYTGINAATLSVLAGAPDQAAMLARAVLASLGEAEDFWALATRAEALMILRDQTGARAALARAVAFEPGRDARASTFRQLRVLGTALGLSPDLLDELCPAPVAHYTGHRISPPGDARGRILAGAEDAVAARIAEALAASRPGAMFGALACGADILFAEAALARGIDLHVVLPVAPGPFCDASVRSGGPAWVARFNACLAALRRRNRVEVLDPAADAVLDDQAFAFAARMAMGRAALSARTLGAPLIQLAVWDGRPAEGPAGTAADVAGWQAMGRRTCVIQAADLGAAPAPMPPAPPGPRVERTLVFGDVKGFSRIADADLPGFVAAVFGAVRAELDVERAALDVANTWGDAFFAAFTDVAAAARFALAVQSRVAALDRAALSVPPDLAVRIGLHAGLVWPVADPVTGARNVFGHAVNRAARIEPVTREGHLFASAEAAALLELVPDCGVRAEYVGRVKTPKRHGHHPLYRLRPSLPDEV